VAGGAQRQGISGPDSEGQARFSKESQLALDVYAEALDLSLKVYFKVS